MNVELRWTIDRCEELRKLNTLLSEARSLDRGSGVVGRIKTCEEIATLLSTDDFEGLRPSFASFLNKLACEDRKKP